MSKTPRFDALLEKIYETLVPCEQKCAECSALFRIEAEDIVLLAKLKVPPPRRCYDCRRRNRLAFLNYTSLYKRKCDAPGHGETMISSIPQEKDIPVYDYDTWFDKSWEPLSLGGEPAHGALYGQFLDLLRKVPHPALTRHKGSVGSEYTLYGFNFKDCYFTFGGMNSENVHYSNWPIHCKDSFDLLMASDSTLSSNSVLLIDSYKCNFCYFSWGCLESDFLFDCKNVQNSFGCVNLRNKKYCWFNEQLTKEEYERRRSEVNLGDRDVLEMWKKKFSDFVKTQPIRAVRNERSENVVGNFMTSCVNCYMLVRGVESENVRYSDYAVRLKDCMDVSISANGELHYAIAAVSANCSAVKFSFNVRTSVDSEFLANCINVSNCFMSVGLENKKFCILNKQYSEDEYWPLLDDMKTRMLEAGEYGEFLPVSSSPYAYNGSVAQIVYPLERSEAEKLGALWYEEDGAASGALDPKPTSEIPPDIKNVSDEVTSFALLGSEGKPFRVIPAELALYRSQNFPIPQKHPYNRMVERFSYLNNLRLGEEACSSCGVKTLSAYKKSDGYTVLCDTCFARQVA